MSRRRSISKFVLASRDLYKEDSTIRVYTEKPTTHTNTAVKILDSDVRVNDDKPSYRVRAEPPSFRVYDSEPSFRVRSDAPSFRVRDSRPSFRVRSDVPGDRVRPGGIPSSIVHGQHQETPSRKVLVSRSHRRTTSTSMETATDPRIAMYKQRKAEQEIKRSSNYQNFCERRRFFKKNQVIRLVPNRKPPSRPDGFDS